MAGSARRDEQTHDEDLWTVPEHWWARAEPFRGHGELRARAIDPAATAALGAALEPFRSSITESLAQLRAAGLGDVADAAQTYLDAPESAATPIGAGLVWGLVAYDRWSCCGAMIEHYDHVRAEFADLFADSWVLEHGVGFAAEATVWNRSFQIERVRRPEGGWHNEIRVLPGDHIGWTNFGNIATRVRADLATAPDADHTDAVRRLTALRSDPGALWARLATSYLLPEQRHWLDQDLAGLPRSSPYDHPVSMLVSALTTPAQLTRFLEITQPLMRGDAPFYSLLTQVGPDAVPVIEAEFRREGTRTAQDVKPLAVQLSEIPTDAAYQALLDRMDHKAVRAELTRATARYPKRAMRLLSRQAAAAGAPEVVRALRLHAVEHPELVAEYVAEQAVPLLETARRLPEAAPDELPAALTAAAPKRGARVPKWLAPQLLPQLRVRGSDRALPEAAAVRWVSLLMAWGPDGDAPGAPEVIAAVDPVSAAAFGWAIFDAWHLAAYPAKSGWVLRTLALVGTDDTVRQLVPFINAWPSKSGSARAVEAVEVIAAIGGDVALTQLHGIAERSRHDSVRTRASEKVEALSAALGLNEQELADRVVPQLGLAAGVRTLDYGSRRFTVSLDHELRPRIMLDGRSLRTLPRPAATDDPELAPAAYRSFREFSEELKTATAEQIRRFESAMLDGRRWRAPAFRSLILEHPVLGHLARRLVWAEFDATGAVAGAFRVDQDHSLADVDDEPYELAEDALLGIAHPLHLGDSLPRWREQFRDYELLQPFEQLDRDVHGFTPEEAAGETLDRFADRRIITGRIYGLRKYGWVVSHDGIYRRFGTFRVVRVALSPGIQGGYSYEAEEQRVVSVRLTGGTFGAFDPVTASELLRQLERLAA
ncbi:DUF4132 domain-containing protein [Nocardia sp. NPDC005978]|uniref:DUF4132 domain-containing protein n=1 Tax=Nocardia sp. NPDC005978 TaxID=3156725 RepID=UPI0033BC114F